MIWEPFVLALFLGLIVSAGLYFAYLWPSVEPVDPVETAALPSEPVEAPLHSAATSDAAPPADDIAAEPATRDEADSAS